VSANAETDRSLHSLLQTRSTQPGRRCRVGTVGSRGVVLTVRQVNIDTPGQPGHTSLNHTYLTSREVIARFRWGRSYGYQMLASTGFPRTIGGAATGWTPSSPGRTGCCSAS